MKDMSLRALLMLGFGTILALLLFVGGYAIVSERSMTRDIEEIANQRLPATVGYGMLNVERLRIRSQTLEVLNQRFPAEQTTAVLNDVTKSRAASWTTVEQRISELDKLPKVSAEAERQHAAMLEQYKEWRQHYVGLDSTIAGMIEASKAEDFDGFAKLLAEYGRQYEAMLPVSRRLGVTLDEISAAQVAGASSDAARASEDGARALSITMALMAVGLVLGVVTGFMIYRAVMNQVGGEPAYANRLLRQVANGDLTVDIALRASDRSSMLFALREMVTQLKGLVGIISDNANHIAAASEQLSAASDSIASSSDDQSQAATSMAASVEEMTVSINHVATSATDADRMAKHSGEAARSGADAIRNVVTDINRIAREVSEATASIEELGEHSREIASVVTIIRELADQTNLLALNAAIEAARAGDQGRGFAVVADEVRKLAERTSSSTDQIARIVSEIHSGTERAVQTMRRQSENVRSSVEVSDRAGKAIDEINTSSREVVSAVEEISQALVEQSTASTEIARNVEQIATMSENNSGAVREAAGAARDLSARAAELQAAVGRFRL